VRLEASATRPLAAGAALFGVLYFFIARAPGDELRSDVLLMLPAALSVVLLLRKRCGWWRNIWAARRGSRATRTPA